MPAAELNAETIELLSSMDSFFIQQRLRLVEAVSMGCFEQPNVYDVFDHTTNKRVMVSWMSLMMDLTFSVFDRILC